MRTVLVRKAVCYLFVSDGVGLGVGVGVGLGVDRDVGVGLRVGLGLGVGVAEGLAVGVGLDVGVGVCGSDGLDPKNKVSHKIARISCLSRATITSRYLEPSISSRSCYAVEVFVKPSSSTEDTFGGADKH